MFHPEGPSLRALTRQALSSTRAGYDLLSPRFDHTPFRTPAALLDRVAEHLGTVEGDALDLCCGTGAGAAMLRRCATGDVVGVDFSPGMLAIARRNVPGVRFVKGDARTVRLDRSFEVVTCFGAFGHITVPEQPAFLATVHRALRPGGRFVFVTADRPHPLDRTALVYRGFNAVMRVRNRLVRPPFVMYYLNFLLPDARRRLERAGFAVRATPLVGGPFRRAFIVEAYRQP
jgi:ubiquinone/menaquinone biosynthesis C-methylase UbiE